MTAGADLGLHAGSRHALLRRVVALSAVAACVEVVGYLDCSSIYPGIMTGNTVQLGLTLATAQWPRLLLIGYAVAWFFVGGVVASVFRHHVRRPSFELMLMGAVLLIASAVRLEPTLRSLVELPLLAIAMAIQGLAISKFGAVSIQTIVVTNSMVKFADAFAGHYLVPISTGRPATVPRPGLQDLILPGSAWLAYLSAAVAGAFIARTFAFPLLLPAVILVGVIVDLTRTEATDPIQLPRDAAQ